MPVCKELEDTILKSVDDKIKSADIYSRDIPSGKIIGVQLVGRGNGKSASIQQAIKEDESIFHEREGWEEEVKLEGQNESSVTFTEDDGIFSFGDVSTVRSLGDITLTEEPCKPKEKKKTLNDIRKEHGFDPVNGEDNEG